jgi:hypothetical protein
MPIQVPALDDRSFRDLVQEVVARIPAHTPEWTHLSVGDPGHTLIDLFAWLTDTLLYRANLIPERQRLAFLRLLGEQMRPALAARTLVSIGFDAPENTKVQRLSPLARVKGPVPFETRAELSVLPVVLEVFRKRPLTAAETRELSRTVAELSRVYPVDGKPVPYVTTSTFPGGKADPSGVDLIADSIDHALWLALLAPLTAAPDMAALRTALSPDAGRPQVISIGFVPALELPKFGDAAEPLPPVPHVFELCTVSPSEPVGFLPLTRVDDTTRELTQSGVLRFYLPDQRMLLAPENEVRQNLDAGVGERPPRIDDPKKAARILGWIRLRPTAPLDSLKVTWLGINAVEIDQRSTQTELIVGEASGEPDLALQLPVAGIETSTLELDVEESGVGFVRWRRIEDLALVGNEQNAQVFQLDAEAGVVRFGDGVRGKIPARGARIKLARVRSGGGRAGNVPAASLTALELSSPPVAKLKVWQPLDASSGEDRETLREAELRIPKLLRHRERAVTAEDYRELALATPGVRVGRVEVLPRFKPQQRRFDVPGVVSVMALPARASLEAPYPRVDRTFIDAVYGQLDPRKPLGAELYVIGCEYLPIAISVGIDNPSGLQQIFSDVEQALRRYLFALAPGGPESSGWPLGRSVRRRELEVVVSRLPGVAGVYGPNLFQRDEHGAWRKVVAADGNESAEITLDPWMLPELISVVVASGAAPDEVKPPQPKTGDGGVAVPVVPEVC